MQFQVVESVDCELDSQSFRALCSCSGDIVEFIACLMFVSCSAAKCWRMMVKTFFCSAILNAV